MRAIYIEPAAASLSPCLIRSRFRRQQPPRRTVNNTWGPSGRVPRSYVMSTYALVLTRLKHGATLMQSRPSLGSYAWKQPDAGGGPYGKRFNRIGEELLLNCASRARTYCTHPKREWNTWGPTTSVAGTRRLRVPQLSRILAYTRTLGILRIQMLQTGFSAALRTIRLTWTLTRSCFFKRRIIFSPECPRRKL